MKKISGRRSEDIYSIKKENSLPWYVGLKWKECHQSHLWNQTKTFQPFLYIILYRILTCKNMYGLFIIRGWGEEKHSIYIQSAIIHQSKY